MRPHVSYREAELLLATTRLAHWAAHNDFELDYAVVFSDPVIDGFIRDGLPAHKDASRGTIRSQLRRVRDVLHGREAPTAEVIQGADPSSPYSGEELARFAPWAARQKTSDFQRDARTLLALGLGAGLAATEIGEVRRDDVIDDEMGVQVIVRGDRERAVPVLRGQEKRLRVAAAAVKPGQYLIRPGRASTPRNFVSNLVDRGVASGDGPQTNRMRATWLVHHLNSRTPAGLLMEAAGLDSLKGLTRFLPFVEPIDEVAARSLLRG